MTTPAPSAAGKLARRQNRRSDNYRTKTHMKITVIGGGAMGTACAIVLAEKPDQNVTIWARKSRDCSLILLSTFA